MEKFILDRLQLILNLGGININMLVIILILILITLNFIEVLENMDLIILQ